MIIPYNIGFSKYFPSERFIIYETVTPQALIYGADRWFDKETDNDITDVFFKLEEELEFSKTEDKSIIKKKIKDFKNNILNVMTLRINVLYLLQIQVLEF